MNEKDLISQLKKLKAVEPDKNWLMAARSEVLSKTPVFDAAVKTGFNISSVRAGSRDADLSRLGNRDTASGLDNLGLSKERSSGVSGFRFLFNLKQLQPAMASLVIGAMILGGGSILTVKASQDSLPGDSLYGIKRMMEGTQMTITPDNKKAILETKFVGRRVEEMVRIKENISDIEQHGKIEKLEKEIEEGAKNVLAQEKSVKTAKIVNTQMDKYASVLVEIEANEELSASVEKVSFQALEIMAVAVKADDKTEAEDAGISEAVVEIETDDKLVIETEKVAVDCSECGEDGKDCLEEFDDEENVRCYQEKPKEGALTATLESLDEEEEIGDVKGAEDEGVLDGGDGEEDDLGDGLGATNE